MNFKFGKSLSAAVLFLFIIITPMLVKAQDVEAFDKCDAIKDNNQKIEAFKKFVVDFSSSQYKPYAFYEIFNAYLDLNKIDSALIYADMTVNSFPPGTRVNVYNNVAFALAQKKAGLDTAAVYSQRAVNATQNMNNKVRGRFLDTQALVLYNLGKADSALTIEKQAVIGNEDNSDYQSNLANYEAANGKRIDAIKTAANAILLGNTDEAITNFNKWLTEEKPNNKDREQLTSQIVNEVLKTFLDNSKSEDQNKVNSTAAAFLANTGVNLNQADKWAHESLLSLKKNGSIDDKVFYSMNYSLVLSAEGKNKEALIELNNVEEIANPWDSDFWILLAQTYRKMGDNNKALDAYINGTVAYPSDKIKKDRDKFAEQEGISKDDIQKLIDKKQNELTSFDPGKFKEKTKGNVVLAELFTGAECPPCAGADAAFDILSEYYSRKDVAILEYHVHIPAPDPMTNPDTFARYKYYGGNFGTPTVIIEGKEKVTGGGPKYLAKNRFNIYKYSINKFFNENPGLNITGDALQKDSKVKVDFKLKKEKAVDKDLSFHIALVEKSINYSGSNGVTKHIFVVRSLIKGADGLPVEVKNGSEKFSDSFNVNEIEKNISTYLDDPTKDSSWRKGLPFSGWKQRTDKIDRNNLAVVAWVQNNNTKNVLQSFYVDVPENQTTVSK